MTSLAHSTTNDQRLPDLLSDVREFGRLFAQGKDSLPMLAVKVAYAAADGVISAERDKDGKDDAAKLYEEFIKAASKKAVHEHTAGGLKANASKLRQIIIAASKPTCDFVDTLNKVVAKRGELAGEEIKVKAAYPAYVEAARMQTEQDDDLTDAQIEEAVRKPDAETPTVEKILEGVEKKLTVLIEGSKGVKDDSPEIVQAHELIRSKLAALMQAREVSETMAKAAALGLTVVTTEPVTSQVAA